MTVWTMIGAVWLGGCAYVGWLFGKSSAELRRAQRRLAAFDQALDRQVEARIFGFSYLRDDGDELAREAAIGLLAWLVDDDDPVRRG